METLTVIERTAPQANEANEADVTACQDQDEFAEMWRERFGESYYDVLADGQTYWSLSEHPEYA
jgi:muramidase (phage lysozyme)